MAIVNITCENDADFVRGFIYQTVNSDGTPGPPVDLSGNTMKMGIRVRAADVTEEMLLTTENGGITVTDAFNGKFKITITQAQLVQLQVGSYEHSLVRMTGQNTLRIWSGSLTIDAGPSR
jgi:hypothetical protein